jgi:predicted anti-sigma-YlaC factor YlaD
VAVRQARIVLAILALALAIAAAVAGTPTAQGHAASRPTQYRPPSGC